jgi:tetrahydromethanopterin S-methyltransferase subunit C
MATNTMRRIKSYKRGTEVRSISFMFQTKAVKRLIDAKSRKRKTS